MRENIKHFYTEGIGSCEHALLSSQHRWSSPTNSLTTIRTIGKRLSDYKTDTFLRAQSNHSFTMQIVPVTLLLTANFASATTDQISEMGDMKSSKNPAWPFPVLPRNLEAGPDCGSGGYSCNTGDGCCKYYMCMHSSGTCELCDIYNQCGDDGCTQCACQPDGSFNCGMNSPCCAGHSCVGCSNGSSQCIDGSAADKCYIDGGP